MTAVVLASLQLKRPLRAFQLTVTKDEGNRKTQIVKKKKEKKNDRFQVKSCGCNDGRNEGGSGSGEGPPLSRNDGVRGFELCKI